MESKRIFIGLAWPYANGSLHLGHVSAFMGADVLARYHRLKGNEVLFVSGSDCYGTPVAVEALQRGINPSEIADQYHKEFRDNLINGLSFTYDIYTQTTNPTHAKVVQDLFLDFHKKGYLYTKTEKSLFSPYLNRFLPDRFVEGACPYCKFDSARGDQCDNCGKLLDSLELINPKINKKILQDASKLKEEEMTLEERETEHFYFKLSAFQDALKTWVNNSSAPWRLNASSFTKAFLEQGLHDRAITRDTDWGIEIPLAGYEGKRMYVWFEAVIGYLSASVKWAEENGENEAWQKWWRDKNSIHYYVHGKDNIPFHTIMWPAILMAEGSLNLPNYIISSEYLTFEGKQFSKSRNWGVWLPEYLEAFQGELLRYFLISNGPENNDADFSWKEFQNKVNGELIGTYGNLVNRTFSFTIKNFPQGVEYPKELDEQSRGLISSVEEAFRTVGELIEKGNFRQAYRTVLRIMEESNRYIDSKAPWKRIKEEGEKEVIVGELAILIHVIQNVAILFMPFTPKSSEKILTILNVTLEPKWEYVQPSQTYRLESVESLFKKVEDEEIEVQVKKLSY